MQHETPAARLTSVEFCAGGGADGKGSQLRITPNTRMVGLSPVISRVVCTAVAEPGIFPRALAIEQKATQGTKSRSSSHSLFRLRTLCCLRYLLFKWIGGLGWLWLRRSRWFATETRCQPPAQLIPPSRAQCRSAVEATIQACPGGAEGMVLIVQAHSANP